MSTLTPRLDRLEKNLIINGAMDISQRLGDNSAALTNAGVSTWGADRYRADWKGNQSGVTIQRVSDAPSEFQKSIKLTVGTGAALVSDSYLTIEHRVEGYNFNQLNFGNSEASSFTLAFWVKSSITGTFGMLFTTSAAPRRYLTNYTISAANTWEKKIINVPADSVASNTTTGVGLRIGWVISMGSGSLISESNSWVTGGYAVNNAITNTHLATTGSTFQLAGVQLVAGTHDSLKFARAGQTFQEELMLCQRYFCKSMPAATPAQNNTGEERGAVIHLASVTGPVTFQFTVPFPVLMRTNANITFYGIHQANSNFSNISANNDGGTGASFNGTTGGDASFAFGNSGAFNTSGVLMGIHWSADAEL